MDDFIEMCVVVWPLSSVNSEYLSLHIPFDMTPKGMYLALSTQPSCCPFTTFHSLELL